MCIFIAVCALIMIWYGVWYMQAWYSARKWLVIGNEGDLGLGIWCCVIGVTLIVLSVWLFRRALKTNKQCDGVKLNQP